MNIIVVFEDMPSDKTGGEYATNDLTIFIDKRLPIEDQREGTIHAVLENYLNGYIHESIDELTSLIRDALDSLEG